MKKAVPITDGVFWTGVLDYDIEVFDIIMRTEYGTSYNSYVVKGRDKTALIEIAKEGFYDEFMERLSGVCDPAEIDYIITNHTEPDHTGALARLLELNPHAEVYGSASAIRFLKEIANRAIPAHTVKDGDSLDLGGRTLRFIMAPFLHWPDSMYTYCEEEKLLFTCDSFGCHYASEKICNDELDDDFLDAYKYYFDHILGPFKSHVLSALDKIKDLDIRAVCTGHGPVLRTNIQKYFSLYREWATAEKPDVPRAAILYVSAYGYTAKLAARIAEGIKAAGAEPALYDLVTCDKEEALSAMDAAEGVLFGSPTLAGDTLPPIWEALARLNAIMHKGKVAGAFGAYGWSGEAVPNIEMRLKQLKFVMPAEGLRVQFNPADADLDRAFAFGKTIGEALTAQK